MQDYLLTLQPILSDGLQLTLAHPLYAAFLIIATFLLTVIVYGIRMALLKRKYTAGEAARAELLQNLANAQQSTGELKERLVQGSRRVADTVRTVTGDLGLEELPLPTGDGQGDEALWQRLENAVTLLADRLRTELQAKSELLQSYRTEAAKHAEKSALAESLQSALADKTGLVSSLEQALQEQKSLLIEEQEKAQQAISQLVEKHFAEASRLAELEQQALDWLNNQQRLSQLKEELHVKETHMAQVQQEKSAPQSQAQRGAEDIETVPHQPIVLSDWDEQAEAVAVDEPAPAVPPVKDAAGGVTGKIKNLFGKAKPEPVPEEAVVTENLSTEAESRSTPVEEELSVSFAQAQIGKIKHLFGKPRAELITTEATAVEAETSASQPEPAEESEPPVSFAQSQFGRIRNLFSMAK